MSSDCGCESRGKRTFLCKYHEGWDDAMNSKQWADLTGAAQEAVKAMTLPEVAVALNKLKKVLK